MQKTRKIHTSAFFHEKSKKLSKNKVFGMDPVRFCLSTPSFRLVFEYDPYGTPPLRMAPFKMVCAVCPEKLQPLLCRDHGLRYTFGQVCMFESPGWSGASIRNPFIQAEPTSVFVDVRKHYSTVSARSAE